MFITYYFSPTCFNRRRDHLQGNLQEYQEYITTSHNLYNL